MRFVIKSSVLVLAFIACGGRAESTAPSQDVAATLPERSTEEVAVQGPKAPEQIADVGVPSALALQGDFAVFTTRKTRVGGELVDAGALFVVDKRVPPALMIAIDKRGATFDALATDMANAYVATSDGRILSVSLAGGTETELVKLDAAAVSLSASGDHVYFARESGAVARVAKTGGAVEALAIVEGAVRGLTADDAAVYVATAPDEGTGRIARISLAASDKGTIKSLASAPGQPCAVVRDAQRLFWTTAEAPTKGAVLRVSVDGADMATVASGAFAACALAADRDSLYFATTAGMPIRSNGGASPGLGLMRAPIAGGEPVRIAEATAALTQPGAVAVDATHLYWLTGTGVMRLAK